VLFHPHGIYLYENSGERLLFVINHAYAKGGERIDVFKVKGNNFEDVSVKYFQTIKPEVFAQLTGILNDLVVVEPGKLYVTQYRAFPDMLDGRDFHSSTILGKIYGIFNAIIFFGGFKYSPVWFCSFDPNHAGETDAQCFVASPPSWMVNGITADKDGYIYVALPPLKEVAVYKRDPSNRLIQEAVIPTIRAVDNLVLDHKNGKIYGGFLVASDYVEFIMALTDKAKPKDKFIAGGLIEITITKDKNGKRSYKAEETIVVPGSVLSGISGTVVDGDHVVFGSWFDEGVIVCPYPQK